MNPIRFMDNLESFLQNPSCAECESENVESKREVYFDEHGLYLQLLCLDCGADTEDGDGDFFDYYFIDEDDQILFYDQPKKEK